MPTQREKYAIIKHRVMVQRMRNLNKQWKFVLISVILSSVFIALFCPYTSILNRCFGIDSAEFWVIGRGILRGKVPYRDLFDHKGPMLFFIWALGIAIGNGTKWGIFALEVISLTVSLIYLYKICELFELSEIRRILAVGLFLTLLCGVIYEGGLSEEWAIPCDMMCMYWGIAYQKKRLKADIWKYGFLIGIFFAYVGWTRLNNAAIIGVVVFFTFCTLLCDKKYKDARLCVITFLLGFLVVTLPIFAYFYIHDAVSDMIFGSFIFNFKYGMGGLTKGVREWLKILAYEGLPIMIGLAIIAKTWQQKSVENKRIAGLVVCTAIVAAISGMLGYTFQHYFMIFLPAMVVLICMILADISFDIRKVVCVLFILILPYSYQIARNAGKCFLINATDYFGDVYDNVPLLGEIIPEQEKDSVWGYGITTSKYFAVNDITPCFKIFDFYNLFTACPEFLEEAELMMEQNPPKWIFRFVGDVSLGENIEHIIQTQYERIDEPELEKVFEQKYGGSQNTGIEVFRRNN